MFPIYKTKRFPTEQALDEWLNSYAVHRVRITIEGIYYDRFGDQVVATISFDTTAEIPKDQLESILGIGRDLHKRIYSEEDFIRDQPSL